MTSFKTFSWIARQNAQLRFLEDSIEGDRSQIPPTVYIPEEMPPLPERMSIFERGKFWPTLILIEKTYHASETNNKKQCSFVRVYHRTYNTTIDVLIGYDIQIANAYAKTFNVPIFSVNCSKKGTRSSAQRIRME